MLKALFLLECDHCHEPYPRISVALQSRDSDWDLNTNDIWQYAWEDGWVEGQRGEDANDHEFICPCCHMMLTESP